MCLVWAKNLVLEVDSPHLLVEVFYIPRGLVAHHAWGNSHPALVTLIWVGEVHVTLCQVESSHVLGEDPS